MNNNISFILPVWGNKFVYLCEKYLFFSLLKEKNIPFIYENKVFDNLNLTICTRKKDIPKFIGKNFYQLRKYFNIKFLESDHLLDKHKYKSFSNLNYYGFKESNKSRFIMFIQPDHYYLNDNMMNLSKQIGKVDIFFCSFLRTDYSKKNTSFYLNKKLKNLEIINYSIQNLHQNQKKLLIDSNDFNNLSPSQLFMFESGYLASKNFHTTPILVDMNKAYGLDLKGTVDDATFLDSFLKIKNFKFHFESDFKKFGLINFDQKNKIQKTFNKKLSLFKILKWTTRRVGFLHWKLFNTFVYYNLPSTVNNSLFFSKLRKISKFISLFEKISFFIYKLRSKK